MCVVSLLAIFFDPTEPIRFRTLVNVGLYGYFIYAALLIILLPRVPRSWFARGQVVIHVTDILIAIALSLLSSGPNSPFVMYFGFSITAAAFRWGFRETIATVLVLIACLFSEAAIMVGFLNGYYDLNRLVIRSGQFLLTGYFIGFISAEEKRMRAEFSWLVSTMARMESSTGFASVVESFADELFSLFHPVEIHLIFQEQTTARSYRWTAFKHGSKTVLESFEIDAFEAEQAFEIPPGKTWMWDGREAISVDTTVFNVQSVEQRRPGAARGEKSFIGHVVQMAGTAKTALLLVDADLGRYRDNSLRFIDRIIREISPLLHNAYLLRTLESRIGAIERSRIARELHDGVIQSLIATEMQLEVTLHSEGLSRKATVDLLRIQQQLRTEVLNIRELMQQLSPPEIEQKELLDFIARHVERFRRETGITARLISEVEEIEVSPQIGGEIARILQEALVNVRKHSGAEHVLINIGIENGYCKIVIDDNGRGFAFKGSRTGAELASTHSGPSVIEERVRSLGGELMVISEPGRGARLEIKVPHTAKAEHA
ncbi:MAG: hypothetical protein JWO13_2489 [Acidobacteriales bacterium]|nr:hypothetical protein [Terriglobales bacterium]